MWNIKGAFEDTGKQAGEHFPNELRGMRSEADPHMIDIQQI
jgi:hypothetical protein